MRLYIRLRIVDGIVHGIRLQVWNRVGRIMGGDGAPDGPPVAVLCGGAWERRLREFEV